MMDVNQRIDRLENWLSRIGDTLDRPVLDGQKFVYREVTPKHVAYLKAVRAVSSLHALPLLYEHGLVIDGGTIVRCINEALSEIFFLLESYPETTNKVDTFIAPFLAEKEAQPIASRKIHSAEARFFEHRLNFNDAIKRIREIYETYSGYVHGRYPHIMQIYGGPSDARKFRTSGVLSAMKTQSYAQLTDVTIASTELAVAFMAVKLDMNELLVEDMNELLVEIDQSLHETEIG